MFAAIICSPEGPTSVASRSKLSFLSVDIVSLVISISGADLSIINSAITSALLLPVLEPPPALSRAAQSDFVLAFFCQSCEELISKACVSIFCSSYARNIIVAAIFLNVEPIVV